MPKFNPKNSAVIFTGVLTAALQWFIGSNMANQTTVATVISAILTILVSVHGALTSSVFEHTHVAQTVDPIVSEGVTILGDVQGAMNFDPEEK